MNIVILIILSIFLGWVGCVHISVYGEFRESLGFAKARGYEAQIQYPYYPQRWTPPLPKILGIGT